MGLVVGVKMEIMANICAEGAERKNPEMDWQYVRDLDLEKGEGV